MTLSGKVTLATTVYRKIKWLLEKELLVVDKINLSPEGKKFTTFRSVLRSTLDITIGNEYQIKINNPTDEEHELIIENTEHSTVASSEEIEPGKNTKFKFKADEVQGRGNR